MCTHCHKLNYQINIQRLLLRKSTFKNYIMPLPSQVCEKEAVPLQLSHRSSYDLPLTKAKAKLQLHETTKGPKLSTSGQPIN